MSTRRAIAAFAIAAALLAPSSPAMAGRVSAGHEKSWGMAGVSLEQYRTDAVECAQMAAATDLEGTKPAKALQFWTRLGNGNMPPNNYADIWMSARINPGVQWNRAATILRTELESCLMDRGYVKFALTDAQADHLRMLEAGSDARRAYLHSLASDPDVLTRQVVLES